MTECEKAPLNQPWKASWPPQSKPKQGEYHGAKKGEFLMIDGMLGSPTEVFRIAEKPLVGAENLGLEQDYEKKKSPSLSA
jgi:hypothetical protein